MSKQTQAKTIVTAGLASGKNRAAMIQEICLVTEAGPAYAATLYSTARKALVATTTPKAPTAGGAMTSFTNANLDLCRQEIETALATITAKYGINIKTGNIRYGADRMYFKMPLEINIGNKDDQAQRTWNSYCYRYGLKPEHYGRTFESNGETYTLSGVKPRGKKFNILAKNEAGKCYKFQASMIERKMK